VTADPYTQLDGAYVLGALDDAELAEFEAHLATCPECRDRVEELRPIVGLLADVRANGPELDPGPMPDTLLPGLLRRAGQEQRRRRWLTAAIGGVAAACLIALAVLVWPTSSSSNRPAPLAFAPVRPSPVHATAVLVSRQWGTEIDLACRYDEPAEPDFLYRLQVVDTANHFYDGGSWTLGSSGRTTFTGGVGVPKSKIKYVRITLRDGTPILQLTA
jgi:hypothetical protein